MGGFDQALLSLVFAASLVCTGIGLVTPAFHVEQVWLFTRDVSVLSGIRQLVDNGEVVIGVLVFIVSVVVPVTKAFIGLVISAFVHDSGPLLTGLLKLFSALGKWSFTDVFIIALGVIVIDGRLLTAANLGPGIYLFGLGAALSWLGTMALHARAKRAL